MKFIYQKQRRKTMTDIVRKTRKSKIQQRKEKLNKTILIKEN